MHMKNLFQPEKPKPVQEEAEQNPAPLESDQNKLMNLFQPEKPEPAQKEAEQNSASPESDQNKLMNLFQPEKPEPAQEETEQNSASPESDQNKLMNLFQPEKPEPAQEEAEQNLALPESDQNKLDAESGQKKNREKDWENTGSTNNEADGFHFKRRRRTPKVLRVLVVFFALIFIVATAGAVFIWFSGAADNQNFGITFYQMQSPFIDNSMRIVLLSDLHNYEFGEKNIELLDAIEDIRPDIICIVGDMMNDYEKDYHVIIDLLNALQERNIAPVFYSYGNHENDYIYHFSDQLDKDIKATGVTVLRNSFKTVKIAGNTISIAGLTTMVEDYTKYGAASMMEKFQQTAGFRLLLAHFPHYFTEIFYGDNAIDVNLALCGHAHGGLIRIPRIGGLYASGQGLFPKLTEGMVQYGNCTVVVSRGLGGRNFPVRINNRPELVVIDLYNMY